jgi:hypothetical protein
VDALELIKDKAPLFRLMEKELTLFPRPLLLRPWVSTYKSPDGRDDELPQLSKAKLRAHRPMSAATPQIFFDIYSPAGFLIGAFCADSGGQPLRFRVARAMPRACHHTQSLWLKYIGLSGMSGKSKPLNRRTTLRNTDFHLQPTLLAVGCAKLPVVQPDGTVGDR